MKHLMVKIWLTIAALFFNLSVGSAENHLPQCPGQYNAQTWTYCIGTNIISAGVTYVGEYKNGKRHGYGRATAPTFTYVGQWRDGNLNGRGKLNSEKGEITGEFKDGKPYGQYHITTDWLDGEKYSGGVKNFLQNGQGTRNWINGDEYSGEFKDGKQHGKGTFTWADGSKYVGDWKDDLAHGQGVWRNKDRHSFVGEWRDGNKHGEGTLTFVDWRTFIGEFKDDDFVNGTIIEKNGDKYVGTAKGLDKHGKGTNYYSDGAQLIANYENGERIGQYTYIFPDGDNGTFNDDAVMGLGSYTFSNGSKYVGELKKDWTISGKGTLHLSNGYKYIGEFKDDLPSGEGIFYFEGIKSEGEFRNGLRHGKTTLTFANGETFIGVFENDVAVGKGQYVHANGDIEDVIWKNGNLQSYGVQKLLRNAFKDEGALRRKQIQYALKKLNYYASSIDGLFGPGTERALTGYAQETGLSVKYPSAIFTSLLSQVSVPSSFEGVKKSSRNSATVSNPSTGVSSPERTLLQGLFVAGICAATPNPSACLSSAAGGNNSIYGSSSSSSSSADTGYSGSSSKECSYDSQCGFRGKCVKRLGKNMCIIAVDENRRKVRDRDVELQGCRRNSDCPRKFRCNRSMRICEAK